MSAIVLDGRFWSKVHKIDGGCWEWTGYIEPSGYGKFNYSGQAVRVYRLVYESIHGAIPPGMCIDHLCRNRACCNPAHLECVSHQENVRRGLAGEMHSHCPHGHEFTPENTYYAKTKTGVRRNCRTCVLAAQFKKNRANPEPNRARAKAWWDANKDRVNAKRRVHRNQIPHNPTLQGEAE